MHRYYCAVWKNFAASYQKAREQKGAGIGVRGPAWGLKLFDTYILNIRMWLGVGHWWSSLRPLQEIWKGHGLCMSVYVNIIDLPFTLLSSPVEDSFVMLKGKTK